jgi:hypothetical protein
MGFWDRIILIGIFTIIDELAHGTVGFSRDQDQVA